MDYTQVERARLEHLHAISKSYIGIVDESCVWTTPWTGAVEESISERKAGLARAFPHFEPLLQIPQERESAMRRSQNFPTRPVTLALYLFTFDQNQLN